MSVFSQLMMRKKEEIMYATIKGTLTENDGVFSGFSASNYLALQQSFTLTPTTKAEFVFRVSNTTFDGSSSFLGMIGSYSINFRFNTGKKLVLYLGNGSSWVVNGLEGTTVFQENNFYYAKLVFDNGVITIYSSTDGKIWTQEATTTVSFTYTYNLLIGRANNDASYQKGSIDLNNSYIKIGSTKYNLQAVVGYTVVGSPTITDGVVSGLGKSNYICVNRSFDADILEFGGAFQFTTLVNWWGFQCDPQNSFLFAVYGVSNRFLLYYTSSIAKSFTFNFSANTKYYYRYIYNRAEQNITLFIGTSKTNMTKIGELTGVPDTAKVSTTVRYGTDTSNASFVGAELFANDLYIIADGKLVFNGQQA